MIVEPCSNQPISSPLRKRRVAGNDVGPAMAQVEQHVETSAAGCWRPGWRRPAPASPDGRRPRAASSRTARSFLQNSFSIAPERDRIDVPGVARDVGRRCSTRQSCGAWKRWYMLDGQPQRDVAAVAVALRPASRSREQFAAACREIPWPGRASVPAIAPQAPTMASHGLTRTSGSAIDRPRAVLELADEAIVHAAEARFLASRRSRSEKRRHAPIDRSRTSGCSMRLNQPMNCVTSRRGMRLVSRKLMSSCCEDAQNLGPDRHGAVNSAGYTAI